MAAGIKIEKLSFSYTPGKEVLKSVSLDILPGEKFGIVGPSGSGKSTLLLHLNGILTGEGKIRIGEIPVAKSTLSEIRRLVGLVFQNPDDQLFNPTVEEDVAFGPLNFGMAPEEVKDRVRETLESLKLNGFEKLTPHQLSQGERQRVALATVLSIRPGIIAFDEPFSSLDPSMVIQLMEIISSLDSTLVITSQLVLPVIALCDRMAILKNGRIIACGPPKQLARDTQLM
ncbi:MAG TPA: energy-coupling factor ABC transporter ATP-binding protein, partial [Bacteroidales bacterium]|nr:energy-coupling factor ABC transporter ATP-binding protein [Bacteroidales bacterium]